MFRWIAQYRESSNQTKYFIWNWIAYGIVLIITTAYVYSRMDYVRSYKMPNSQQEAAAPLKKV